MTYRSRLGPSIALAAACSLIPVGVTWGVPTGDRAGFVLTDITAVPMNGDAVVQQAAIVVSDGVITWIGPAAELPTTSLPRIDGEGAWVMPGLIDMHAHIRTGDELALHLLNGVTTIANLAGRPDHLEMRAAVAAGTLPGPTIYTAGPVLDGDPPRNRSFEAIDDPAEAERVVREQAVAGYDFIKIYDLIGPGAYRRAVDTAHELGLPVVGHIPKQVGLEGILDGHDLIAHAEEYFYTFFANHDDRSRLAEAARLTAGAGITVCPNTGIIRMILEQVDDIGAVLARPEVRYVPPSTRLSWLPEGNRYLGRDDEWIARNRRMYPFLLELTAALHRAGVRLVVGTDSPVPGAVPGFAMFTELADLERAGLSNFDLLRAATAESGEWIAEYLHPEHPPGILAPGRAADLLLLDGDPLEDWRVLQTGRRAVVARGRWIDLGELREDLDARAESYARVLEPYGRFKEAIEAGDFSVAESILEREANEVLGESGLNRLGYYWLYRREDAATAIAVFEMNTRFAPRSANVWDSLGEALAAAGREAEAIAAYRKSLALDPDNTNARAMITEIESGDD